MGEKIKNSKHDIEKNEGLPVIACVVGARPNFVKIAPIMRALAGQKRLQPWLVHTGQHYDVNMSKSFFEELNIPHPDVNLEVGSGTATQQTAAMMVAFEELWIKQRPALILVVGDVNSTLAAALVAVRMRIPIVHVEAGLRSGDRGMPEEINRILTDSISDLLYTSERGAEKNLVAEGIAKEKVIFSGNVMIDSLFTNMDRAVPVVKSLAEADASSEFSQRVEKQGFALVTLHRPSNVDFPEQLKKLLDVLVEASARIPVIFPVHPRTRNAIESSGFTDFFEEKNILTMPPASYLKIIGLMRDAKIVITDSGGIQEETTALGVPCLTVRDSTERPTTITEGTNILIDGAPEDILLALDEVLKTGGKTGRVPELWDGKTAERIAEHIANYIEGNNG